MAEGDPVTSYPTDEQLAELRAGGYTIISTLNGLHCIRPGDPAALPWQEALKLLGKEPR